MTYSDEVDWKALEFGLPDRLRKAMEYAGLELIDMAEYCGVSRFTVSRYMNGRNEIGIGMLRLWAMRTGVPLEWLQTGETPDQN